MGISACFLGSIFLISGPNKEKKLLTEEHNVRKGFIFYVLLQTGPIIRILFGSMKKRLA
jgi:hypothetical protein